MITAVARRTKPGHNFRKLRNEARQQVREMAKTMQEMEAIIDQLNVALGEGPPQSSPLDEVQELLTATQDLRVANGNLSATAIARAFGISVNELAGWLGRSRQSLTKTPDADSLQNELAFFERVARLRVVVPQHRFLKWLRMPNPHLDSKSPLELLGNGERQVVVDLVEDMLTGAPS